MKPDFTPTFDWGGYCGGRWDWDTEDLAQMAEEHGWDRRSEEVAALEAEVKKLRKQVAALKDAAVIVPLPAHDWSNERPALVAEVERLKAENWELSERIKAINDSIEGIIT